MFQVWNGLRGIVQYSRVMSEGAFTETIFNGK